jgi:hypothetical protein
MGVTNVRPRLLTAVSRSGCAWRVCAMGSFTTKERVPRFVVAVCWWGLAAWLQAEYDWPKRRDKPDFMVPTTFCFGSPATVCRSPLPPATLARRRRDLQNALGPVDQGGYCPRDNHVWRLARQNGPQRRVRRIVCHRVDEANIGESHGLQRPCEVGDPWPGSRVAGDLSTAGMVVRVDEWDAQALSP